MLRHELHFGNRLVRCHQDRAASVDALFRRISAEHAEEEAVIDGDRRLTYGDLAGQVDRLAANLARCGIGRGDRVALLVGNQAEFVTIMLAVARLGAVSVPIGTRLQAEEVTYICRHAGAAMLIFDAARAALAAALDPLPSLNTRVCVGGEADGAVPFESLLQPAPLLADADVDEDDLFMIAYTSGTTGRPKGAMVSHLGAVHAGINWQRSVGAWGRQTAILAIPASHMGGIAGVILPMIHCGGKIVMMPEFKVAPFLRLAEREGLTYGVFVPAIYNLCLLDPGFRSADLSTWRFGIYSGAPMPEVTIRRMNEALPQLKMINAYGATEATSAITVMPEGEGLARLSSVGKVVACGDIVVMDEDGKEVPPGEPGEVWISGPMVIQGYWQDEEATRTGFADGYWKSGDIGAVDEDGYVSIFGRKKEMINRGGMKVFAAEVESVLKEHPAIIDVAIIGRPDPVLGERVHAVVVSDSAIGLDEVQIFCSARLADYKTPEFVSVQRDPLPRNANGKVIKRLLMQEIENHVGV